MASRRKTVALVFVAAAAALVPLFGDPRLTPVTHPIWARMLLRGLEMNEAVRASTEASQVFSALSWRDSLTFPADRYTHGDGVTVQERSGVRTVAVREGTGQVDYPLTVVRAGDYQMRVRLEGKPDRPATGEIVAAGGGALRTFKFASPASIAWVRGGPAHLDPGTYTASLLLPEGSTLEYVEVAPPCLNPIEPIGGWRPAAPTTVEDVAVTVLKAMDVESELPPADTPLERSGADFQIEDSPTAGRPAEKLAIKADREGVEAILTVDLPEAGLYTISVYGTTGQGERWLADGCRKAILCASEGTGWRVVMSQSFGAGRHMFSVVLTDGGLIERVRIERKKERPPDYLGTLRRLGFDPGPDGPVSWDKAAAAMRFVQDHARSVSTRLCGDVVLPERGAPSLQVAASTGTAAAAGAAPAPPPPPPDIGAGLIPPQLPVSPVQPGAVAEARPGS